MIKKTTYCHKSSVLYRSPQKEEHCKKSSLIESSTTKQEDKSHIPDGILVSYITVTADTPVLS